MRKFNPDIPSSPERLSKPVRFYIMFENSEERDKAKSIILQMLDEDKSDGIYQIPAGPDYPLTVKNILNGNFREFHNDENPETSSFGLEISFDHTPGHFPTPEALENFLLRNMQQRGLKLRKKDGHAEAYEVVGEDPQSYTPEV